MIDAAMTVLPLPVGATTSTRSDHTQAAVVLLTNPLLIRAERHEVDKTLASARRTRARRRARRR